MSKRKAKHTGRTLRPCPESGPATSLSQKLTEGPFAGASIIRNPDSGEKMSEVLRSFVDPYAGAAKTKDAYSRLLTLALLAWNAALTPETERLAMIEQVLGEGLATVPASVKREARAFIDELIRRKLKYFAENRRMIVDFTIDETPTRFHLTVVSTLLPRSTE